MDIGTFLFRLFVARQALVNIVTHEEMRALQAINKANYIRNKAFKIPEGDKEAGLLFRWSITKGVVTYRSTSQSSFSLIKVFDDAQYPLQAIERFMNYKHAGVMVLCDIHSTIKDPKVVRALREAALDLTMRQGHAGQKNIVLLSHKLVAPPELDKHIAVLDLALPSSEDIGDTLKKAFKENKILSPQEKQVSKDRNAFDGLVYALQGLTSVEISNVIARSIAMHNRLEQDLFLDEKRQIIRKSGMMDFVDTKGKSMDDIGGLEELKEWLKIRQNAFTREAQEYGLPWPKGMLLLGPPGTGKSLVSKTVGAAWGMPVLELSMGRVFEGLVGKSEENLRTALQTAEALSPCVLQIDEIEKALGGGDNDGGTSQRVFGSILSWMQDKVKPVFVVATANDISKLPPELLRKGRFDEIFFVDFPVEEERKAIFEIHLRRKDRDVASIEVDALVSATDGFSGAEIEQAVIEAMFESFAQGKAVGTPHLLKAVENTVPLIKTMSAKIETVRHWAKHRARFASAKQRRRLDGQYDKPIPEELVFERSFGGIGTGV